MTHTTNTQTKTTQIHHIYTKLQAQAQTNSIAETPAEIQDIIHASTLGLACIDLGLKRQISRNETCTRTDSRKKQKAKEMTHTHTHTYTR